LRLTKENITFINSYLLKAEVEYIDIRMEMVDHVASEIETAMIKNQSSFYSTFKAYMLAHKRELLKTNKKFKRAAEKKVWKALGKEITKPSVVVFGVIFYFFMTQLKISFNIDKLLYFFPIFLLFGSALCYAMLVRFKKLRFSGIERTGAVFCLLSQIPLFMYINWPDFTSFMQKGDVFINLLICILLIAFIRIFQSYRKEYQKYSSLNFI